MAAWNRAATELHMVQSNVTARIRALEEQVGTELFLRTSRGVVLTAAGQRLLPYASRVGALLKEAREAARDDGTPRGALRIGTLETTAALRLPTALSSYTKAYPEVALSLTTGTTCSLIEDVVERRLDGAFVAAPVQHADLVEDVMFREELMLVTAPALRNADDFGKQRDLKIIVFRRGCSYRQRLGEHSRPARHSDRGAAGIRLRSMRSLAASPRVSASRCCRKRWCCPHGVRGGCRRTSCRPNRPASIRCSSAARTPTSPAPWLRFWTSPGRRRGSWWPANNALSLLEIADLSTIRYRR